MPKLYLVRHGRPEATFSQAPDAESAVIFSHFVAINVAVGEATGDDRVAPFSPDHCSVTVIDVVDGALRLVERGTESVTPVLPL